MASEEQYVFGYGSLLTAAGERIAELRPRRLRGYRRTWNVAMDNSRAIPGYKQYLDPATGLPPPCFVVFLNIVADVRSYVNGAIFAVSDPQLAELDRRERNYKRIEVTSCLGEAVAGTVWTYTGSPAALERFATGLRAGTAVVSETYAETVRRGFAALGEDAVCEFEALTDPPPCPLVALRRVTVPTG